jgi:hypothetical protein
MFCLARTDDSTRSRKAWGRSARPDHSRPTLDGAERRALDAKRREVQALLDEIRAPAPGPGDIIEVVQSITGGVLNGERLIRLEAGIRALYVAD